MMKLNEIQRREFVCSMARRCLGVSIGASAAKLFTKNTIVNGAPRTRDGGGQAKSVIYLFLNGGLTHIDTFDPKPDAPAEIRGPVKTISTNVPGIQLGHCLPKLARQADKLTIVRSMNSTQGAHKQGRYMMRTGYLPSNIVTHPSTGGWVNRHTTESQRQRQSSLPRFVTVGCGNLHPGAGFMDPEFDPLPIGSAARGVADIKRSEQISEEQFQQQLKIRQLLDDQIQTRYAAGYKSVRAHETMFQDAINLMKSDDLQAFDIQQESPKTLTRYGTSSFAQGVLLARRLVEYGVDFIEVELGGFDWHGGNFESMEAKVPAVDHVVSTLLQDLESRGLLESTLVVLGTEFGRSPRINQNAGRDHFPKAFSVVMAGGGTQGGHVHGATDEHAAEIESGFVDATNVNATIGYALGIPFDKSIYTDSGRPFQMNGENGEPIRELF